MRLYIAGKVTGDPDYKEKFENADMRLSAVGYIVKNPTEYANEDMPWDVAMRWLIPHLVSCDGVALLPDWWRSKGARLEVYIAKKLGIPCKSVKQWMKESEKC